MVNFQNKKRTQLGALLPLLVIQNLFVGHQHTFVHFAAHFGMDLGIGDHGAGGGKNGVFHPLLLIGDQVREVFANLFPKHIAFFGIAQCDDQPDGLIDAAEFSDLFIVKPA